jgi:hypothetical protein
MTRFMWAFCALVLFAACADQADPPAAPVPELAGASSAFASGSMPLDASLPDRGPDASASDAAASDASQDGGIKIVAQMPIFIADEAPTTPKRRKRTRKAHSAKKSALPVAGPPEKPAPAARRVSPMQTIRAHYGDVHHCYAKVALKDPTVAGRVTLQWTIGKTGMPQAVAITKNTLKDKSVGACLKVRAKKWKFPPPNGGVQVISYPFDLRVQ